MTGSWRLCSWGACGVALFAGACESTGVGNPVQDDDTGTVALAVVDDSPSANTTLDVLSSGQLTAVTLVIEQFFWNGCGSGEPLAQASGPFVVDLVAGTTNPELPSLEVTGAVCGLEVRFAPGVAPAPEVAVRIAGALPDGGEFAVTIDAEFTVTIVTTDAGGFLPSAVPAVIWALQPGSWLTLDELVSVGSVDADALRALVLPRIGGRSTLHEDLNGNLVLDPAEREPSAILGRGRE